MLTIAHLTEALSSPFHIYLFLCVSPFHTYLFPTCNTFPCVTPFSVSICLSGPWHSKTIHITLDAAPWRANTVYPFRLSVAHSTVYSFLGSIVATKQSRISSRIHSPPPSGRISWLHCPSALLQSRTSDLFAQSSPHRRNSFQSTRSVSQLGCVTHLPAQHSPAAFGASR